MEINTTSNPSFPNYALLITRYSLSPKLRITRYSLVLKLRITRYALFVTHWLPNYALLVTRYSLSPKLRITRYSVLITHYLPRLQTVHPLLSTFPRDTHHRPHKRHHSSDSEP